MDNKICTFDEATHTYYLDGVKKISVTQLLTEQGIKTDFSKVKIDQQTLAYASLRGTTLHEEIENFIKDGIEGVSEEFRFFRDNVYPLRKKWYSEVIVYCDDYCGRCDAIGVSEGEPTLVTDIKTGSSWDKIEVAWQDSLYARCLPKDMVGDDARMMCIDLHDCKLVDVGRISEDAIKKLIECHKKGEVYQEPQLVISADQLGKVLAFETAVAELETAMATLKTKRDEMRENLLQMFREQGVKSYESPNLKITYVAPTTRDGGIDTKLLKDKYKDAYNACHKASSPVKDSIRVTVRSVS
jgi:hypothetical protein